MGYTDSQIPAWFARPRREARTRSDAVLVPPLRPRAPAQYDKSSPFLAANQLQTAAPGLENTNVVRQPSVNVTPIWHIPSQFEVEVQKFAEEMEQQSIKEYNEDQLLRQQEREALKRKLKESEKTPGQRLVETWASPEFLKATRNLTDTSLNNLTQVMLMEAYPQQYAEAQAIRNTLCWMSFFRN